MSTAVSNGRLQAGTHLGEPLFSFDASVVRGERHPFQARGRELDMLHMHCLYGTGNGGWWRGPKDEPPIGGV